MATKKKPKVPDKKITKSLSVKPKKEVKKDRRYVAERNLKKMLKEGWKEVKEPQGRKLGVKTSALGKSKYEPGVEPISSDLILMEK